MGMYPFGGLCTAFFTGPFWNFEHRGGAYTRETASFSHFMRAAALT